MSLWPQHVEFHHAQISPYLGSGGYGAEWINLKTNSVGRITMHENKEQVCRKWYWQWIVVEQRRRSKIGLSTWGDKTRRG